MDLVFQGSFNIINQTVFRQPRHGYYYLLFNLCAHISRAKQTSLQEYVVLQ